MSRSFLVVALFGAFGVAAANAAPIDPYIHIGDPGTGTPVGLTFGFSSNVNGGGVFNFINASQVTFTSLDFFVTLPTVDVVTCVAAPFFSGCSFSQKQVTSTTSLFQIGADSGPGTAGIAPGTPFFIVLNDPIRGKDNLDPAGSGGWGPNNAISAVANLSSTPEPATWGLIASGLCAAVAYSRTRRNGRA